MKKGLLHYFLHHGFVVGTLALLALSSCTKQNTLTTQSAPILDQAAVTAPALKNCHFQKQNPTYAFNSAITPNPLLCDEGFPRTVQVLSPTPLPSGLEFNANQFALVGTATEKVVTSTYKFYLENDVNYVIVSLQITVQ